MYSRTHQAFSIEKFIYLYRHCEGALATAAIQAMYGLLRHFIPRNDEIKKILFLFAVLFSISSFSQTPNKNLKEYSYAQLFDMIAKEKDSVFTLKDAHIKYNAKTDSLLTTTKYGFMNVTPVNKSPKKIVIDKQLKFTNVYFSDKFYRADI